MSSSSSSDSVVIESWFELEALLLISFFIDDDSTSPTPFVDPVGYWSTSSSGPSELALCRVSAAVGTGFCCDDDDVVAAVVEGANRLSSMGGSFRCSTMTSQKSSSMEWVWNVSATFSVSETVRWPKYSSGPGVDGADGRHPLARRLRRASSVSWSCCGFFTRTWYATRRGSWCAANSLTSNTPLPSSSQPATPIRLLLGASLMNAHANGCGTPRTWQTDLACPLPLPPADEEKLPPPPPPTVPDAEDTADDSSFVPELNNELVKDDADDFFLPWFADGAVALLLLLLLLFFFPFLVLSQ